MIVYRWADDSDRSGIVDCVGRSMGIRQGINKFMDTRRTVVAVDNGKVIGTSGLKRFKSFIPGWELNITCVDEEYRGQGVCKQLVQMIISRCREESITRLFWSAWHLHDRDLANPYHVMKSLGFVEVIPQCSTYRTMYNCDLGIGTCTGCKDQDCMCCEDLWCLDIM